MKLYDSTVTIANTTDIGMYIEFDIDDFLYGLCKPGKR